MRLSWHELTTVLLRIQPLRCDRAAAALSYSESSSQPRPRMALAIQKALDENTSKHEARHERRRHDLVLVGVSAKIAVLLEARIDATQLDTETYQHRLFERERVAAAHGSRPCPRIEHADAAPCVGKHAAARI